MKLLIQKRWKSGREITLTLPTLLILLSMTAFIAPTANAEPTTEIGKRIYLEGLLPSGKPIQATVQGDVSLSGLQVSCVGCHQRSGLGSSESGRQILPITKKALYERREIGRTSKTIAYLKNQRTRPLYNDESLAKAIRKGIDPNGRSLNRLMPRFSLSDNEMQHLIRYIKTLSVTPSPGVSATTLHFATVISDEITAEQRHAMIKILTAFVKAKNAATRFEDRRAQNSPWHKEPHYTAYRKWDLELWNVNGPNDTWRQQLDQYYDEKPIFALLSGLSSQSWQPIHQFCKDTKIPCLFPNTALPPENDADFYSIYFSQGVILEARVLAQFLSETLPHPSATIVQVINNQDYSQVPATILHDRLNDSGIIKIHTYQVKDGETADPGFLQHLYMQWQPTIVVFWLDYRELSPHLTSISSSSKTKLFFSSTLTKNLKINIPTPLRETVFFTHPFDLPSAKTLLREKAWAKSQHITISNERIIANTYFAVTLANNALKHIQNNFYRDYFIEKIEHMIDSSLSTSVYPHLSLGPLQRFASKGSYIVQFNSNGKITPVSDWIIP